MEILEKDFRTMEYIKIYGANVFAYIVANASVLSTVEFIDIILKICVAIPTIAYTIVKIMAVVKNELRRYKK